MKVMNKAVFKIAMVVWLEMMVVEMMEMVKGGLYKEGG